MYIRSQKKTKNKQTNKKHNLRTPITKTKEEEELYKNALIKTKPKHQESS